MKKVWTIYILLVALGLLSLPGMAQAVDGVVLINQARALAGNVTPGDAPGFPVTISRSGSYRLAGNLTVPDEDTTAIRITSNNVTVDLNGFVIAGPTVCSDPGGGVIVCEPTGTGVGIAPGPPASIDTTANITVLNGTVEGMGNVGIVASRVTNVTVNSNGGTGIIAIGALMVSENTVSFNGFDGIRANTIGRVIGNTVLGNGGFGLRVLATRVAYASNVFTANEAGEVSGGIEIDTNVCGYDTICP